ncbi:MAG: amino acid adenylation domain-containing protein, partial [Algicola sp.]|nr:amino acid adenylation domain-containing protein [Algicola sp.]
SFTPDTLRVIVEQLYLRHDALRLRFDGQSARHQALDEQMIEQSIEVVEDIDFDAMQVSLSLTDGPLFKAVFLLGHDDGRLLLIIHHLVVDGVSWRILMSDIEQICAQLFPKLQHNQHKTPKLPAKTSSYQQWGAFLADYSTSDALLAERQHWLDTINAPVATLGQVTSDTGVGHAGFALDENTTTQLLKHAGSAYRSQINELLLAGLLLGLNKWSNRWSQGTTIRIDMEGHGRESLCPTIDLSQTVGWFTSLYPLTLSADSTDVKTVICAVKTRYRAIPNQGIGFGVLKYLAKDTELLAAPASDILFNYLGQFDDSSNEENTLNPVKESMGQAISPNRALTHGLVFNGIVREGCLDFDLGFDKSRFNADSMAGLAELVKTALVDVIDHCIEPDAGCLTPEDFPLTCASLNQPQLDKWLTQYPVEDIYPATPMQQGLLFHSAMDDGAYVTQLMLTFDNLNPVHFQQAWQRVLEQHCVLRTVFASDNAGLMQQIVLKTAELTWHQQDLSAMSGEEQAQTIEAFRQQDKAQGFDVEGLEVKGAPLMRFGLWSLGNGEWQVLWSHHHALIDGWCLPLIIGDVVKVYQALHDNAPLALPAPRPYREYVGWLAAQDKQAALDYWQTQLADIEGPTPLPERPDSNGEAGVKRSRLTLTTEQSNALVNLAKTTQTTVNVILQGAWSYLLSKYSGESSVVFGSTVSGRPPALAGIEQMVGLFINTLPTRVDIPSSDMRAPDSDLTTWLQGLLQAQITREEFGFLGLSEMTGDAGAFDSLLVFENYPMATALENTALVPRKFSGYEGTDYGLSLTVALTDVLDIKLDSQRNRFSDAMAEQMLNHLEQVLMGMVETPLGRVDQLPMLTKDEQHYLLNTINDTAVDHLQALSIHEVFERQVEQAPQHIALTFANQQLSYQQLNEKANRLADDLRAQGVKPDTLVGVYVERSLDMIVAVLAILKAGGAYLPLDPNYPQGRLDYMVQDSGIKLLLSQRVLAGRIDAPDLTTFYLDEDPISTNTRNAIPQSGQSADNLAYVIYTSGSTGQPKGVMVEHRGAVDVAQYSKNKFTIDEHSKVLGFASLSFDAATWEWLMALLNGANLVICSESIRQSAEQLQDFMVKQQVTHAILPPALLEHMAVEKDYALSCLVVAGERCEQSLAERWSAQYPMFNGYGPTETTVIVTVAKLSENKPVSIGQAIDNTQLYVLDKMGELLPMGAVGELHIGGAGLARGYLNRQTLTDERFIENPFGDGRLYKTGDLVRYLPGGELDFVGRVDEQVQIRGFRVELGEVEYQLIQQPQVKSAVVVVDDQRLVAFFIGDVIDDMSGELDQALLCQQLRNNLPEYMIPSVFIAMDEWPLTANGKIDKKALPKPDSTTLAGEYVAPSTDTEKALTQIWAPLLNVDADKISATADFFEMGGHSILVMRLLSNIKQQFLIAIVLAQVFERSRLNALAAFIDELSQADQPTQAVQIKSLRETEDMDDEDDMEEFDL